MELARKLRAYIYAHPFDSGNSECETVLDQLYEAYFQSHEADPQEIKDLFYELDQCLTPLPLSNNSDVFNLVCHLCTAYAHKAFIDGLKCCACLIKEVSSAS